MVGVLSFCSTTVPTSMETEIEERDPSRSKEGIYHPAPSYRRDQGSPDAIASGYGSTRHWAVRSFQVVDGCVIPPVSFPPHRLL
jgi:hypothetical protein